MKQYKRKWKNKANLFCPDKLWSDFKQIIPDNMTINDYLVFMVAREVDDVKNGRKYNINN